MENIEFQCRLETVAQGEAMVSLFQGAGEQGKTGANDEFLLHLDAEVKDHGKEKVQQAEFIIVVDKSGSMQGTPWKQVQGALCKMLELTKEQGNIRTRVIAYNHQASQVALTGETQVDNAAIKQMRAGGSTSFVSAFKELSTIFKDTQEDSSKAFFVFFMTDGEDTCSEPKEIMAQKELMQTDIEKFGAEVVFNVLGFSEQHDEQFLESLTFLGTSDGTYSFVTPSEGDRAVEERLVALVQSTSSVVGRSLNIEMKSSDLQFLGDNFGEGKSEVVVPAMVSKNGDTIRIVTMKFVKKMPQCSGVPKIEIKVYEKLTGTPKAIDATIVKMDEVILDKKVEVADHNLKKMRTALNMITSLISEADKPEQVEKMKVWHKLVQEKFAKMSIDEKEVTQPMRNRLKAVQSGIDICNEVYAEGNGASERERGLRQQAAAGSYQMMSKQAHNRKHQKTKAAVVSNRWMTSKASRSELQSKSKQADYTEDDFVVVEGAKKAT